VRDDEIWTYRPRSAPWVTGATWLVVVGFTAASGADGGVTALLRALPFAAAAALAAWCVGYRPHVRLDDEGVLVVNPFATHRVPWAALIEIRTRFACTFVTPHRAVEAFAAPGPGRYAAAHATSVDLRSVRRDGFDHRRTVSVGEVGRSSSAIVATQARRRWERLVESDALELGAADDVPVTSTLDVTAVVVLTALVVVGAVLQLVG